MNLKNILKKPLLSVFTLVSMAAALVMLGLLWTVVENLERVRISQGPQESETQRPGITVFIDSSLAAKEIESIRSKILLEKRFVDSELISAEKSLQNLQSQFGETISRLFESDTLPVTVKVYLAETSMNHDDLLALANSIRAIPGVLDVDEGLSLWSASKKQVETGIFSWATTLLFIVFIVVAMLVSHLIRLAFESFKPEIETLKILGATRFWIFKPFLLSGLILGLLGGLLALGSLLVLVKGVVPHYAQTLLPKGMYIEQLSLPASLELLALAVFASLLGAFLTWPIVSKAAFDSQ